MSNIASIKHFKNKKNLKRTFCILSAPDEEEMVSTFCSIDDLGFEPSKCAHSKYTLVSAQSDKS